MAMEENGLCQGLLTLTGHADYLGISAKADFDLGGRGWGLKFCISTGSWMTLPCLVRGPHFE